MLTNPVTEAVATVTAALKNVDPDAVARLEATATLEAGDWLTLGDLPSRAALAGKMDQDVAQSLFAIHSRFNSTATLAERIVYLELAQGLLKLAAQRAI